MVTLTQPEKPPQPQKHKKQPQKEVTFPSPPPKPLLKKTTEPPKTPDNIPLAPTPVAIKAEKKKTISPEPRHEKEVEEVKNDITRKPHISANKEEIEKIEVPLIQAQPTSSVVEARPMYRNNPKPRYPSLALKRGWEGTVILSVKVCNDGSPDEILLLRSSGHKSLDSSAIKAVKKWSFLPGTENGIPVAMVVHIPVHFSIK